MKERETKRQERQSEREKSSWTGDEIPETQKEAETNTRNGDTKHQRETETGD